MILVVYSHVCGFCLGDSWMGFNDVFFLFRLPCFFFISGWLFQPSEGRPFWPVTRHKLMVQIVPTVIFLLLLAPPPLFFSRLGATKGGYWFTFALFEFFVLYLLSARLGRRWSALLAVVISVAAFSYDACYHLLQPAAGPTRWVTDVLGLLSFMTWRYYLFFYIGTWVRRHFSDFQKWTDRPAVMALAVAGFGGIALLPHAENAVMSYLVFAVGGVFGLTIVFTLFRRYYPDRPSALTFVGQRTLDIYLLHYFFLPRFLTSYGPQLRSYDSRLLELGVGLAVALAVVCICLAVSYVIRLSPMLGHILFGAKHEKSR